MIRTRLHASESTVQTTHCSFTTDVMILRQSLILNATSDEMSKILTHIQRFFLKFG